ncbi:hypothetical protein [Halapricum hydrolyticum]|uniref:Uncharacterized protein n=1 Tax=Halapricum hydrolyticum TaxID=2979991 RepID=A0AAE3LKS4_9EURY|nr:hypothetical protein [Halapricum hydrolyticum]MCU4719716.1 hypothetical protein [Halapricum hydrolyticum]MCU4728643.1 hypothetical protein [Halapricum hydrolyticum]
MTVSSSQMKELHELTEYERWSLTRLAELSGDIDLEIYTVDTLVEKPIDEEVALDGSQTSYRRVTSSIGGSGVNQVISDITPLIFASSYKCLDLFVEWFLKINGRSSSGASDDWRFSEKISEMETLDFDDTPNVPSIFQTDERILEAISSLYIELKEYRHSIIHDMDFELNNSKLIVENGSGGSYVFGGEELFSFAGVISVSIEAIISDTHDYVTKRQLTTMLDNLTDIHDVPRFDLTGHEAPIIRSQMEPVQKDPYRWEPLTKEISQIAPVAEGDENFWLNLVGLHNGDVVSEWIIPGDEVTESLEPGFDVSSGDFRQYTV